MDYRDECKQDRRDLSFFLLLIGLPLLFVLSPQGLISNPLLRMLTAFFIMPGFMLGAVLIPFSVKRKEPLLKDLGFQPVRKADFLAVLLMIPLFFVSALISLAAKFLGVPVGPQKIAAFASDCPGWVFLVVLFTAGVLAPIAEELAFRRVIYDTVKEYAPRKKYVPAVITSLVFALSHGIIWQSVILFFLALILQWQCGKGSLTRSVLMHASFNWCSLVILILGRCGMFPETIGG